MFSFLSLNKSSVLIPAEKVKKTYYRLYFRAMFGIVVGYCAYYFVRSNISFSTPYLKEYLNLNIKEVGLIMNSMLISYGIGKGFMSALSDKANPKYFLSLGLILSAITNLLIVFALKLGQLSNMGGLPYMMTAFILLVILNGVFQGMGVGPCLIIIAKWTPRKHRGMMGGIWNISHNLGGGIVPVILISAVSVLGLAHWQFACYGVPALLAIIVGLIILLFGAGTPYTEGLPTTEEILKEETDLIKSDVDESVSTMTTWQIFRKYVLPSKSVWYLSFVEVFVYMTRFGVITWLPIYLLQEKNFSHIEMGTAFACFEWAAIPSTLAAGYVTDRFFKGRRMPLQIVALVGILIAIFMYWLSTSVLVVSIAAAVIGCLIFVPQAFLGIQRMDLVPSIAIGSATGMGALMGYLIGTTFGTSCLAFLVHQFGWDAGFYLLLSSVLLCIVFSFLTHLGVLELEADARKSMQYNVQ